MVEEPHADGEKHYHAVVKASARVRLWCLLNDELLKARVKCDVTVSSNPKAVANMLRYVLCPTQKKNATLPSPRPEKSQTPAVAQPQLPSKQ